MTQYHYERPPTAAVETAAKPSPAATEKDLKHLIDRVSKQDDEIQELKKTVRRLQNELRLAVNTFNIRNHG
jgi:HAMP domain-containing protein